MTYCLWEQVEQQHGNQSAPGSAHQRSGYKHAQRDIEAKGGTGQQIVDQGEQSKRQYLVGT